LNIAIVLNTILTKGCIVWLQGCEEQQKSAAYLDTANQQWLRGWRCAAAIWLFCDSKGIGIDRLPSAIQGN
jgi:hypothetical protein